MSKSHAARWAPDAPSPDQLKELFAQIASGRITVSRMQAFLRGDMGLLQFTDPEVVMRIPALKRPTLAELQAFDSGITAIERDDSPEEEVTLRLGTLLAAEEPSINGSVYEERLIPLRTRKLLLGFQHRAWMLEHQGEFPFLTALLGKVYVDFPGIVVRGGGDRRIPYALRDGGRWGGCWSWIGGGFSRGGRVAVSGE